ncbi:hypothetical protein LXM94_13415 [Rhizobium sp. TRM95111]|uniref:hypothetical protein n=1 Tax=Rhizobium alarense TaxID=2846851 RepID=UPI001F18A86B|nr:hypothetical protein [Rhizobium alarense]MCF3640971.1 hypothetical protein [Rhizobium alarense]
MTKRRDYEVTQSIGAANPRNATEHILNLLKAGLATAPFCGGIASLMTDYIPSAKQKRLEEFVDTISNDLTFLANRVNEQTLSTENFAFIFEHCFRGVAENYQHEKLEAFRGILVNSATGSNIIDDEQTHFLTLVNRLSAIHLRILSFMADPIPYLHARNIPPTQIFGGFSQFFPIAIPGIHIEVIKNAFGDLYQAGMINTDKSIFTTMTSSGGIDLLGNRVSDLGGRFIRFCKSPAVQNP